MTELTPPTGEQAAVKGPPAGLVGRMRTNGNHRYDDGTQTYQRVSNLLKNLKTSADSYHLDMWKKRQIAIGMARRPDLVLAVAAATQIDPATGKLTDAAKDEINGLCKQADDAAASKAGATQGTAVHTATERLDLGESLESIGLPYPFDADLRAYDVLRRAMKLEARPNLIERSVRTEVEGTLVVGSFDRIWYSPFLEELGLLEPGEGIIGDVKSEENPLLNLIHIAPQLATYANAREMWVPEGDAGRYEPMPRVSTTIGLVVHVRNGRATPYLIDLVEGWESARAAELQRRRVIRSKIKLGEPGCWAAPLDVPMPPATEIVAQSHEQHLARQPEYKVGDTVTVGGIEFTKHAEGPGMAMTAVTSQGTEAAVVQQAVRNSDGTTTWHVVPDGPQPLEAMLWEAVMAARTLDELALLYDRALAQGVEWRGPISEAGMARAQIVRCAQRSMHDPATTAKCACGWTRELAP